eukprot:1517776-Alexandrium_andersonii.AAC.1
MAAGERGPREGGKALNAREHVVPALARPHPRERKGGLEGKAKMLNPNRRLLAPHLALASVLELADLDVEGGGGRQGG